MDTIEFEYVFEENTDTTLDNILISILNSNFKVVDFQD